MCEAEEAVRNRNLGSFSPINDRNKEIDKQKVERRK